MACVPTTAIQRIRAGRMDQKGRASASGKSSDARHGQFQIHQRLDMVAVKVKYALAQIETSRKAETTPMTPRTVEIPSTKRMFQASGLSL